MYTGTHDNDTTSAWWELTSRRGARPRARGRADAGIEEDEPSWLIARLALASPARTAIVPVQDLLGLDNGARMNTPGREAGNWSGGSSPGRSTTRSPPERARQLARPVGNVVGVRRGTTAARLLALAAISLTTYRSGGAARALSRRRAARGNGLVGGRTHLSRTERKRLEYVCPADGKAGTMYGTDVYTDDSSVCTAAVHDGRITAADGGTITVEIRPGQDSYESTTRNGVKSTSFGQWSGSFAVVAAEKGGGKAGVKMGGGGWDAEADNHRGHNGVRVPLRLPVGRQGLAPPLGHERLHR